MKDSSGYPLSGCNSQALDPYEQALHEMRCYIGDPVASVDRALAAAPELVMGHVLRAWLHLLGTEPSGIEVARRSLALAAVLPADDRERRHLHAARLVCDGQWRAAARLLEDLNLAYPLDALALQAGHAIDFFTGDSRMLRDRMARVSPLWSRSVTGYHALLAMYAFGLEETGDYALAEAKGREAVDLEPRDCWAHHAVAHVLEMQGRRAEGVRWMNERSGWRDNSFFAVHNWWHLALHHIELGAHDEALALYDGPIAGAGSTLVLDLVDASALLWRLMLRGADVGERWIALAARWEPVAGSTGYAFNDVHAVMAFAAAGRDDLVRRVLAAQAMALQRHDDNADFTREIGGAATQAVAAYAAGAHDLCVDLLRPVRHQAHRFGGSHAQRDLIDQTLIAAAERAGQASLARSLQAERSLLAGQRARR